MNLLTNIGFGAPWLLLGLLSLPLLYWLLRATPPAPIIKRLGAISLLLNLRNSESTPQRTPWWLLLLRMIAIGALIVGFADPALNFKTTTNETGRLVIALDSSWASAQTWTQRRKKLDELVAQAARDGRPVAIANLSETPPEHLIFQTAQSIQTQLSNLQPAAWSPDYAPWQLVLESVPNDQIIWFSDGLLHNGKDRFAQRLKSQLQVVEPDNPIYALRPLQTVNGTLQTQVLSSQAHNREFNVQLRGIAPNALTQTLARQNATLANEQNITIRFDLPTELRNRVNSVVLDGVNSAGAIAYSDDSTKRKKIALLAGADTQEAKNLLAPLHYLRNALTSSADLIESDLETALVAKPDAIIFADVARLSDRQSQEMQDWIKAGGLLVRFAGPRLVNSKIAQHEFDPLLPVLLRQGGRDLGGKLSWGNPKRLKDFDKDSPFFGLDIPDDLHVNAQVLAQPHPSLEDRVLARLADGTPLISAYKLGEGRVVLFHITANAQWSNLPLSGLFVKMLERLAVFASGTSKDDSQVIGQFWTPSAILDGFGRLQQTQDYQAVTGDALATQPLSAKLPAGIYNSDERTITLNVTDRIDRLIPMQWPAIIPIDRLQDTPAIVFKPYLLLIALGLLLLDLIISTILTGRLFTLGVLCCAIVQFETAPSFAQDKDLTLLAANHTVLAHIVTGDNRADQIAKAGLRGLVAKLTERTSIEPIEPISVDLENDDISALPFLYWPMALSQPELSPEMIEKLNRYLRRGGMIMFDTRDAHLHGVGEITPRLTQQLQRITAGLDIPPLANVPTDHVLTRAYYLLSQFPGRHFGLPVWVEAPENTDEAVEGMPFRNLNDGVSPVIIGANDWAAAWAIDGNGRALLPVGQGEAGQRQREYAIRFGINVIMYVMSGNYKSDQVHVPALLERLGQ